MKEHLQEKRNAFESHVLENARLHAEGKIPSLASLAELSAKTGYSPTYVEVLLGKTKLGRIRAISEEKFKTIPFPPSSELAWFIGYTGGASYVDSGSRFIKGEKNPETREKYTSIGKHIFDKNPQGESQEKDVKQKNVILFSNSVAVNRLGDLSRERFAETFSQKYSWTQSPEFIWDFLSGIFDGRAIMDKHEIRFLVENRSIGSIIQDTLMQAGIERPYQLLYPNGNLASIAITNIKDARIIAQHIKSANPKNAEKLKIIQASEKKRGEINQNDLMLEWQKIYSQLGDPVKLNRINNLYKHGMIKSPLRTYLRLLGENNYQKTREVLTNLTNLYNGFKQKTPLDTRSLSVLINFAKKPYIVQLSIEEKEALGRELNTITKAYRLIDSLPRTENISRTETNDKDLYRSENEIQAQIQLVENTNSLLDTQEELKNLKIKTEKIENIFTTKKLFIDAFRAVNNAGEALFSRPDTLRIMSSFISDLPEPSTTNLRAISSLTYRIHAQLEKRPTEQDTTTLLNNFKELGFYMFGRSDISIIIEAYEQMKNNKRNGKHI